MHFYSLPAKLSHNRRCSHSPGMNRVRGNYYIKQRHQFRNYSGYILISRGPDNQDSPVKIKVLLKRLP